MTLHHRPAAQPLRLRRGSRFRALVVALILAVLPPLAAVPARAGGSASSAAVERTLPPSNSALLFEATRGAARRLVAQVPLNTGARVILRAEGTSAASTEVAEALLEALTGRRVSCILLAPVDTTAAGTAAGTEAGAAPAAAPTHAPGSTGMQELQRQRLEQAARADSAARGAAPAPGGAPAAGRPATAGPAAASGPAASDPVLTYRVLESRVDYVRQFRSGLFGAQRIERRALTSVSLRLAAPGSEAVTWTATADSTVGDVVLKSDLPSLEDRARPETRPTPPSSSIKKVLEPVLVLALIAGLVALFYQNRP